MQRSALYFEEKTACSSLVTNPAFEGWGCSFHVRSLTEWRSDRADDSVGPLLQTLCAGMDEVAREHDGFSDGDPP
jgi:hypothetical protein